MTARFSTALLGGASLLALAGSAFAQQAPTTPAADAVQTVVVTGSRIVRYGYTAPTPVTVAPTAELEIATPSSISDGLNKLPEFAGSSTSAGSTNAIGGSGGGTPSVFGGNYLDLRDLGAIRTLILVDGQRVPPTSLNGQVDTNTLPQMLVKRVDVVTGGASAVYGSDAVAGVVNFILDTNYTGLKAQAETGLSSRGDAQSTKYGVAGGGDVLGGHLIWSVEHQNNNGIDDHANRPWSANTPVYVGAGTAASPYVLVTGARLNGASLGGLALSGPFAGQQFLSNGSLAPFNKGTPTATSTISTGGDGAYYTASPLIPPVSTDQMFARFDHDLTGDVKAYIQVSGAQSKTYSTTNNYPSTPVTIYSGNAFLTPAEQALLGATPSFSLGRLSRDLVPDSPLNQLTDSLNVTAGLKGTTFDDFSWDAYYTHGTSILRSQVQNNINLPNLYAALDAVNSGGNVVCRVTVTNPGQYPGCAPLNLLGTGNESPQALAYIFQKTQWQAVNTMDDVAASLSGSAFSDWAGPVSTAFNAEYRALSLNETSNANPVTVPSVTGIRLATAPTTTWAYGTQAPESGAETVWEISGETVVPLLKDMNLAKHLDVTGAVRYTDYSVSGSATTWKIGLNYQPIEDVRFRVTQSRDIRAPDLTDLYSGTTVSLISLTDPLTGHGGVVTSIGGGNKSLVPEVANTTTAGIVYSPSWLSRFKISADYYNITMNNAIGSVNGASAAVLAQCDASGGTSPLCSSIVRPISATSTSPLNYPSQVYNLSQNIGQLYTHGVEAEASYNFQLSEILKSLPGRFDLRALYDYQPVLNTVAYPGAQVTQLAGVAGLSSSRVTTFVDYRVGPVSLSWEMRYLSGQRRSGTPLAIYSGSDLPAIFYHDVNATYRFRAANHDGQLFIVVDNLLDQQPRISPSANFTGTPGFGTAAVGGDDLLGRYFTVGLRVSY